MRKRNKIICIILSCSLMATMFTSVASGNGRKILDYLNEKKEMIPSVRNEIKIKQEPLVDINELKNVESNSSGENQLVNSEKPKESKDNFNFNQEDVKSLIESGHSLEDIIKADALGNKIMADPKELLHEKMENNKNWEDIEKESVESSTKENLEKLVKAHPEVAEKLEFEKNFSPKEKLGLLSYYDNLINSSLTIEEIIKEYKNSGYEGLYKLDKKKNEEMNVSENKNISKKKDANPIDEKLKQKIEKLAEVTGKSNDELYQGFKEAQNKIKGDKNKTNE
ncbi:hypothetical protein ACP26L_31860 [Paenibacillus sp. S-38]|uniref:hypothetical protein n=1 Tax=Paenibacillus sp. S-38 TaxID=3416710 RepID=UPI003CFA6D9E